MRMYNDCLPCIARGSLDAAKLATDDENRQLEIVKQMLQHVLKADLNNPPPLMAKLIQETVQAVTGVEDPYCRIKKKYNDFALELLPELEKKAQAGSFETALRLCIAGNIIDFGTHNTVGRKKVLATIEKALVMEITGEPRAFESACRKAENILWIADNAGEIVFDTLLLSRLDLSRVTYAVRGGPTQNDATRADAEYTGITKMVNVIDTGAAIPGVILDRCSSAFKKAYDAADLIVSKGQGNFETLSHEDDRIYFLFKAKCPVVAQHAGCLLNDMVIRQGGSGR